MDNSYLKKELYQLFSENKGIFEFLQLGSLDGVWYWDLENPENEWLSPRFWEVLGYDPNTKEHLASEWQGIIHPEDLEVALENFDKHCADPTHPYDQIVRYKHQDNSTVWIRCRGMAIRNSENKPIRMLGAHTDISTLKRTELELQERNKELSDLNRQLNDFSHMVSHDLKVPLAQISKLARDLTATDEGNLSDRHNMKLDMIAGISQRLEKLIQGMLQLANADHGEAFESVDLSTLIHQVVGDMDHLLQLSSAKIEIDVDADIWGDPAQLYQVFLNLIDNAIKYRRNEAEPTIKITSQVVPERRISSFHNEKVCRISISDNGLGFDENQLPRVLSPFQRLHSTEVEGSGIGMATVNKIINHHNGSIGAKSQVGIGSTFLITLPLNSGNMH